MLEHDDDPAHPLPADETSTVRSADGIHEALPWAGGSGEGPKNGRGVSRGIRDRKDIPADGKQEQGPLERQWQGQGRGVVEVQLFSPAGR